MDKIKVKILNHNFNGMPLFLAKLTQRGSEITSMSDLIKLYEDNINKQPSEKFMKLPHSTIFRMCEMTVAIYGLSTKAVSQLRTHATRLTFVSTSTQYSEFTNQEMPYVIPEGLTKEERDKYIEACKKVHQSYIELYDTTKLKDESGYLLPQSLRKCLIIHGNFPAWQYMLSVRLCNRNTREVQYICELILDEMDKVCNKEWAKLCLPSCVDGKCKEGKFCCGKPYQRPETKNTEEEGLTNEN